MTANARLLVIVPALNEADSIRGVVDDARSVLGADVVVVDDGSRDRTGEIALRAGATVLTHPFNLGVGGAIRTALKYASRTGYERVVQLDGDGQHDATEAKRLIERLDAGDVDMVVGSRFAAGYDVQRSRRVVMKILSVAISRVVGTKITDTTSGFRAMNRRAIEAFANEYPVDYLSDTVEALLMTKDLGLTVTEVVTRMRQRQGGSPSSSGIRSTYHLVRLLVVLVIYKLRRRPGTPIVSGED